MMSFTNKLIGGTVAASLLLASSVAMAEPTQLVTHNTTSTVYSTIKVTSGIIPICSSIKSNGWSGPGQPNPEPTTWQDVKNLCGKFTGPTFPCSATVYFSTNPNEGKNCQGAAVDVTIQEDGSISPASTTFTTADGVTGTITAAVKGADPEKYVEVDIAN